MAPIILTLMSVDQATGASLLAVVRWFFLEDLSFLSYFTIAWLEISETILEGRKTQVLQLYYVICERGKEKQIGVMPFYLR